MKKSLLIVYASTSGHTEFVVDGVIKVLETDAKDLRIRKQRAEMTKADDLLEEDVLILASSTWNTGNIEGQLNPHMHDLLLKKAPEVSLSGKKVAVIGLGDERYFYTAKATDHIVDYVSSHSGELLLPPLKIINEPFDQGEKIESWAKEFVKVLPKS